MKDTNKKFNPFQISDAEWKKSKRGINYVMPIGKHRGKTLLQISDLDPGYIVWLQDNQILDADLDDDLVRSCRENEEDIEPDFIRGDWGDIDDTY